MYVEGCGKKEGGGEGGREKSTKEAEGIRKWLLPVTTSLQRILESSKKDGSVGKGQDT